jgi:hypothetical protein
MSRDVFVTAAPYSLLLSAAVLTGLFVEWRIRRRRLRRRVFSNLDSAAENGYFAPGEQLHNATTEDIAQDLVCYSDDFGDVDAKRLEPHVCAWLYHRGLL